MENKFNNFEDGVEKREFVNFEIEKMINEIKKTLSDLTDDIDKTLKYLSKLILDNEQKKELLKKAELINKNDDIDKIEKEIKLNEIMAEQTRDFLNILNEQYEINKEHKEILINAEKRFKDKLNNFNSIN